ncbi:LTA synthase family protein [Chitinimonas koreensis]|uniref:LTA synthase family protein n=1 Tax=Chitinimonas koreensis TaxID=356302 RepID=UPI00041D960E|nr:LTA synthase family protein [Chitinimonas koreensis]QNM94743.1 sulfatase-like hydrolase/transferase [Chitinimonas koreensis]
MDKTLQRAWPLSTVRVPALRRDAVLRHRFGPLWLLALAFLAISQLTRLALLIKAGAAGEPGFGHLLQVFGIGLLFDLVAAAYFFVPLALYLFALPDRLYRSRVQRWALLLGAVAWLFLMLFNAAAEWTFWDEFGSRYNFIAVDYLLYTHEVIGNIRESYPVGTILGGLALAALAIAWRLRHALWASLEAPSRYGQRLGWLLLLLALPLLAFEGVDSRMKDRSDNRYVNALAGNGVYEFFAAAYNNELDYATFYRALPLDEAFARLRRQLPTPHARLASAAPRDLTRIVAYPGAEKRLNVVLISVESLSAEFMSRFGNHQGLTPRLDRLAAQGLLLTNLYANGTRTVRGLEALALSVPPTPGQSIVKRPGNAGLFSLGEVFKSKGYEARYVYGGYGYFDNMNAFFSANGYQVVDRTAIPAERIHHENIWGVADEDLFTQAIEEADRAWTDGKPSFMQVMTTSNHRPFTYPDGRIDIPSKQGREGGVKYTDWAIGDFIDRASTRPWFDDTVFLIVADHCASSAGKTDLPVNRYHIPALFYSPKHIKPAEFGRLASQTDLAPTLLGLLNFSYTSRFLGYDLFDLEPGRERAFIGTYQDLGFIRDGKLVQLDSRKGARTLRPDFEAGTAERLADDRELTADAIAWYQAAAWAYGHGGLAWKAH